MKSPTWSDWRVSKYAITNEKKQNAMPCDAIRILIEGMKANSYGG